MMREEKRNKKERMKASLKKYDTSLLLDNSPIVSSEEYGDESEILQYKIKAVGVKNIAVVGSFGAGKSSAIETYLKTYRPDNEVKLRRKITKSNDTYTRISLASFNDAEYKDSDIERSILQQLLYSQPKYKLPNSRVERTTITPKKWTTLLAFTVMILVGSILLFSLQIGKVFLHETKWLNWFFLGFAGLSFFVITWLLLHFRKLLRVKYKDFELEVKEKDDVKTHNGQSLINKFVDEVLYFFESTKIDLVIFEDLDRLEYKKEEQTIDEKGNHKINTKTIDRSSAILVKLRELNTLINNSQQCKRKVTFLYAIKDDMIKKQEERAKFFEFILPIVPILNPVTKAKKMHEEHERMVKKELRIKEEEPLDYSKLFNSKLKLDSEFISAISNYIPNMRTLKNAFNEYIISHGRIFKKAERERLHNENLFALSLYKNLYPNDYADLENATGIIPIIMNKKHLITNAVESSKDEIKRLHELLEAADKEHLQSFEELKCLLEMQIIKGNYNFKNAEQLVSLKDVTTFQEFDFTTLRHRSCSYHGTAVPDDIGAKFAARERVIIAKTKEGKEKIANFIETEQKNISKFESMTLHELIKIKGVDFHFKAATEGASAKAYLADLMSSVPEEEKVKAYNTFNKGNSQIGYLKFLIQNDYLDEKYMEYISGYESKTLSSFDEDFILRVQQGEQDFNHRIDNPGHVIDQIRVNSFSDPAILNNTILLNLSLIKAQTKNNKYKEIKSLLDKEMAQDAVKKFIQNNNEDQTVEFLKHIIDGNTSVCGRLLMDGGLAKNKKDIVIQALIEGVQDYDEHNADGKLSTYIGESENYEEILGKVDLERAKAFLIEVKPRIETLRNFDNEITKFIIDNNLYQINTSNLEMVLQVKDESSDFYKKNYAFISYNSKVKAYIDANPNEYVKNIFASIFDSRVLNKHEDSSVAVDFLNREGLASLQQIQIIRKYPIVIERIDEYATGLHSILLECNRVKPTWENILFAYLNGVGFNDIIKKFVLRNANDIEGGFEWATEAIEDEEDSDRELVKDVCEDFFVELANAFYTDGELLEIKKVVAKIGAQYNLDKDYNNDDVLPILIAEGMIKYSNEGMKYLLDKQSSLRQYVLYYSEEVSENFDKFFEGINAQGLKELILYDKISRELKQKLITEYGGKITAVSGFEMQYYRVIKDNRLNIPTVLLMRFKDCTVLTNGEKMDLATLTYDKEESTALPLYRSFMESVWPDLENESKDIKIDPSSTDKSLFVLYAKASERDLINHKDGKITIKKSKNMKYS